MAPIWLAVDWFYILNGYCFAKILQFFFFFLQTSLVHTEKLLMYSYMCVLYSMSTAKVAVTDSVNVW